MEGSLFTNRNSRKDFIDDALRSLAEGGPDVYIATAFFTDASLIRHYVENGCKVRLIIRLGFPTHPNALGELLKLDGVEARYFTHHSFHPKLYIFGAEVALVGSANLTLSALKTNQEIMVTVRADDPRFDSLATLFSEYWREAKVLGPKAMQDYRQKFGAFANVAGAVETFDKDVVSQFGDVASGNINRGEKKDSEANEFIDSYEKSFQECVGAFEEVQAVYQSVGKRKVAEELLPLRIEIDGFISVVRELHAKEDSWRNSIASTAEERLEAISRLVSEWHENGWDWFDNTVVPVNYPKMISVFKDQQSLSVASESELFEALCTNHAFWATRRYHKGGLESLRHDFFHDNKIEDIKRNLSYLAFGNERAAVRMSNLIYNPDYKLHWFGRAAVQELVGWVGREKLPIINGRTTKVLHYFGFKVNQV